ncbi:trypsin-like serine peptidase [Streptomyces sp. NPDC055210]
MQRLNSIWALCAAAVLVFTTAGCQTLHEEISESFSNPPVPGFWTPGKMSNVTPSNMVMADESDIDTGVSDPEPLPVTATAEKPPYLDNAPVLGKVFFETPDGPRVCSGTAVEDPRRPKRSSLVWTAGHCVHQGKNGTWYKNIVFVPSYNNDAIAEISKSGVDSQQIAPLGVWWADQAEVSQEWTQTGEETGGAGSAFDFAALHVRLPAEPQSSLEEAIGYAIPVSFDAPAIKEIATLKAWGYPAEKPFDGNLLFSCQDRPTRLAIDSDKPTLYRIGCTMNGGSSGGGWFIAASDGSLSLVSNTSIGPSDQKWLAGPRLGSGGERVLSNISERAE